MYTLILNLNHSDGVSHFYELYEESNICFLPPVIICKIFDKYISIEDVAPCILFKFANYFNLIPARSILAYRSVNHNTKLY